MNVDFDEEISIAVWNKEAMAVMLGDCDLSRGVQQEVSQKMAS